MAGFLGEEVPVFEIENYYNESSVHDLLVNSIPLGAALANTFTSVNSTNSSTPDHTVVLMRGHGFATFGDSIEQAVYRGIYTQSNAKIETTAIGLAALAGLNGQPEGAGGPVRYLNSRERRDAGTSNVAWQPKAWELWVRQAERDALYDNFAPRQ